MECYRALHKARSTNQTQIEEKQKITVKVNSCVKSKLKMQIK